MDFENFLQKINLFTKVLKSKLNHFLLFF